MSEATRSPTATVFTGSNPEPTFIILKEYNIHAKPTLSGDGKITISTPPKTDLWRKPPSLNVSTAPTLYTTVPLSKFKSARVTAVSNWNTLYDQAGLVLFVGSPEKNKNVKWVKSGIEYVFDLPHIGTVAADAWADWSLASVPGVGEGSEYIRGAEVPVTIEIEREVVNGKKESSLWVYKVDGKSGKRMGVREVTWVFEEDTEKEGSRTELWVGIYAARPTTPEGEGKANEELKVVLTNFEVKLFANE